MSIDVGERLRFVRGRNKLSQRELAKRSGVTNSTISLIESNQMNPSVGALKRILDGIPMGMAEFFALEPDRPRKAFYRSDELSEIGKGPISYLSGRRQSVRPRAADPERALRTGWRHRAYPAGARRRGRRHHSQRPARGDRGQRTPHPRTRRRLLFREPPAAPLPLRRRQTLRTDQRLHAADVLRATNDVRCRLHSGQFHLTAAVVTAGGITYSICTRLRSASLRPCNQPGNHIAIAGKISTRTTQRTWMTMKSAMPR